MPADALYLPLDRWEFDRESALDILSYLEEVDDCFFFIDWLPPRPFLFIDSDERYDLSCW